MEGVRAGLRLQPCLHCFTWEETETRQSVYVHGARGSFVHWPLHFLKTVSKMNKNKDPREWSHSEIKTLIFSY